MTCDFSPWPPPPDEPRLIPGVVHIWCLPLDLEATKIEDLRTCLSADEAMRASRYHFETHRRRFIACRGQVRRILSAYLESAAGDLTFSHGGLGKPALATPWNESAIQFNVSNSGDVALLAVAVDRELGVDVEQIHEPHDFEGLAARFFARSEVDQLQSLPEALRLAAFFNGWTRKEAVLKAVGTGLAFPLENVVVTLVPGEPAHLLAYDDDPVATADWRLAHLEPAPGYVGALALRGGPLDICCWRSEASTDETRQ